MSLKEDLKKLKERLEAEKGNKPVSPGNGIINSGTLPCGSPSAAQEPLTPPKPKKDKPPKEKAPANLVTYKCGHIQPVGELKNHDCRACQKKTFLEKSGIVPRTRGKQKGRPIVGRLPRGSRYTLAYQEEGERKWWYGELLVPVDGSVIGECFAGEADSVHYLLDLLGKKWRDWEKGEAAKRAGSDTVIPPECSA